jgi:ubiquinone/menaquinone biosynthesis C-methylase UbiE
MIKDKPHFYDGKIYDILFDSALKEIRQLILSNIKKNSKVLDIASGTGSLVFDLSKICSQVIGVELSSKMVKFASSKNKMNNVSFIHADASSLKQFKDDEFDYATVSMAIHEMPPVIRIKVLQEMKRVAKIIIIADYTTPLPHSFAGLRVTVVEFLADHFKYFQHYQKSGGIKGILKNLQLDIIDKAMRKDKTIEVITVK